MLSTEHAGGWGYERSGSYASFLTTRRASALALSLQRVQGHLAGGVTQSQCLEETSGAGEMGRTFKVLTAMQGTDCTYRR